MRDGKGAEDDSYRVKARSILTTPEATRKRIKAKRRRRPLRLPFFRSHFADIWRSKWVCFMPNESKQGN
jgi:hypothetical protein